MIQTAKRLAHLRFHWSGHWRARSAWRDRPWLLLASCYSDLLQTSVGRRLPGRHSVIELDCPTLGPGVFLRMASMDLATYEEIVGLREYDSAAEHIVSATRVVDLGANIGLSVRYWLSKWPGCEVVAVEPDPANVLMLRRNTDTLPVTVVSAAVSTQSGMGFLGAGSVSNSHRLAAKGVAIRSLSIPDVLAARGWDEIDLLKVDIEGEERPLFANAASWLPRVRHICVELHDDYTSETFLKNLNSYDGRWEPVKILSRRGGTIVLAGRRGDDVGSAR